MKPPCVLFLKQVSLFLNLNQIPERIKIYRNQTERKKNMDRC